MENLDINSINTNLSVYGSSRITIEYTGGIHRARLQHDANYKVTVTYDCLAQKLQNIRRFGGKIVNISSPHIQADLPQLIRASQPESVAVQTSNPIPAIALEAPIEEISDSYSEAVNLETPLENLIEEPSAIISDILPEVIAEIIPEIVIDHAVEPTVVATQKAKTTAKSGSGFNKPKSDTRAPRSQQKPKK